MECHFDLLRASNFFNSPRKKRADNQLRHTQTETEPKPARCHRPEFKQVQSKGPTSETRSLRKSAESINQLEQLKTVLELVVPSGPIYAAPSSVKKPRIRKKRRDRLSFKESIEVDLKDLVVGA